MLAVFSKKIFKMKKNSFYNQEKSAMDNVFPKEELYCK